MQDLEEQDRDMQGVIDRVIAGEQDTAGQESQSVVNHGVAEVVDVSDADCAEPPAVARGSRGGVGMAT